ncbi:MAG: hypothetical protein H6741_05615 [Alphaproteobacteria bacterium]|nr:hypothetical protein [Alphaproteobacteria bacterium]
MRILPLLTLLAGCAPTLEEAPASAADRYCTRAVECNWYAADEFDTCVSEMTDTYFEEVVVIDECQGIDRKGWASCVDTIDAVACDSWTRGIEEINPACEAIAVCEFLE